jgi:two-component system OmpR family response regulator
MATFFPSVPYEIRGEGEERASNEPELAMRKCLEDALADRPWIVVQNLLVQDPDKVGTRELDFVVIDPDRGLVTIEVKGGQCGFDASHGWHRVVRDERRALDRDASSQAISSTRALVRALAYHGSHDDRHPPYLHGWFLALVDTHVDFNTIPLSARHHVIGATQCRNPAKLLRDLEDMFSALAAKYPEVPVGAASPMRIRLVEDDAEVARFVKKGLQEAGHTVEHAANGRDGLFLAASEQFDILVLDRMLPGGVDGVRLVETLRGQGNRTPVLFLSALGAVDERVKGLKAGGDDYLVKPFAFAELLARVEALARRPSVDAPATRLRVADLELDLLSRTVTRSAKKIDVQPREFRLLEHLMRHAGQVVTRTMLLEKVWDYYFDPQTNVIDVHVSRLRQKLDKGFDKPLIHTVRNAGYMIRAEP